MSNRDKAEEQAKWKKPENAPVSSLLKLHIIYHIYHIYIYILITLCYRLDKTKLPATKKIKSLTLRGEGNNDYREESSENILR